MQKWHHRLRNILLLAILTALTMLLCICLGSVRIPLRETLDILRAALQGETASGAHAAILLRVRLPRVLCTALVGATLSLCGCAMQGLLRNPLADGSTLGVASGASLGAALAILLGWSSTLPALTIGSFTLPALPFSGTTAMAMLFAFLSLCGVLLLAWKLDRSMSTESIVLIGVIFSMFISALMSVLVLFSGEKLRTVTFWTMGSLASAGYDQAGLLLLTLLIGFAVLLGCAPALNAFALGEDRAMHLGVPVRRVKLTVMITASALVGVCVSIGGCIGFVGLVMPHMLRLILGPDHRQLMPASLFGGAAFLMLCDLVGRTIFQPVELPIGVVTSLIGAVVFVVIFARGRRRSAC